MEKVFFSVFQKQLERFYDTVQYLGYYLLYFLLAIFPIIIIFYYYLFVFSH